MEEHDPSLSPWILYTLLGIGAVAALVVGFTVEPGPGGFNLLATLVGFAVAEAVLFTGATLWLLRGANGWVGPTVLAVGAVAATVISLTVQTSTAVLDVAGAVIGLTVGLAALYTFAFLFMIRRPHATETDGDVYETDADLEGPYDDEETSEVVTSFTTTDGEESHPVTLEEAREDMVLQFQEGGQVITVAQLLAADRETVAAATQAMPELVDLMPALVEEWQAMAHLCLVPEVEPAIAETLALAGVTGPEALAQSDPEALLEKVREVDARRNNRVFPNGVRVASVKKWIRLAGEYSAQVVEA